MARSQSSIAQTTAQQQANAAAPASQGQLAQAVLYPNPCGNGQSRQDSDLCAQWTAATAARDSSLWDGKIYSVELYGAVGVGISLFFSAAAAILALLAYRSTKRTEVAQTRGYVFPESVMLSDGVQIEGESIGLLSPPGAVVVLKNYGATPAREIRHWSGVNLCEWDRQSELPVPDTTGMPTSILPPQGTTTYVRHLNLCLTPHGKADLATGVICVFVHGAISYRDVYDRTRITKYKLEYRGVWPPNDARMTFSTDGNESD